MNSLLLINKKLVLFVSFIFVIIISLFILIKFYLSSNFYFEDIKKQIYVNDVELYKECEMRTLSTYDKLYGVSKYQRKAIEIKGKIYLISL